MKKIYSVIAIVITLSFLSCNDDHGDFGSIGEGGGYIFFSEGGHIKECSGDLGKSEWYEAQGIAKNFKGGGYDDWQLPARNELDLMYRNLKKNKLGDFKNTRYWSSESRYYQNFITGYQNKDSSSGISYGVRAVRSYIAKAPEKPQNKTKLTIKNDSFSEISGVKWNNVTFTSSTTQNSIKSGSSITKDAEEGSGYIYFRREANLINARTREQIIVEKDKEFTFTITNNTIIVDVDNPDRSGTFSSLQPLLTTLKIKNESSVEITDVIWQNVTFANNQYENSILSGTSVTKTVQPNGGYIFFKRKSNPIIARTSDMIIIENNDEKEFTFNDNTSIVEINNANNTGTLGSLNSTVVWWDDAEGDYLPYQIRRYTSYSTTSPRFGSKCIYLQSGGELTINISLEKNAKLSFWHRCFARSAESNLLSINNEEIKKWEAGNEWSYFESPINTGSNIIQFKTYNSNSSYLYLDNLLIFYTE